MRILMLNYEFPPIGGGASPVSYDIGKRLAEMGHEVTVVTMAFRGLPRCERMDGMDVRRVKCWRTQKMVCHPWEQATYVLSAARYIKRHFGPRDFDVCYAHFIIPTGVVAWWVRRQYGLPYLITSHGSDVIGHNAKRFGALYAMVKKPWRAVVRKADAVVCPSRYLERLVKKAEPAAKTQLVRNGVDSGFFRRTREKKRSILVMCRLQETKNVQCILEALPMVKAEGWTVNILGDGPCREGLERLALDKKLEGRVFFRGWVTNKSAQHLKYLQEAAVYLSASRVENCPTAILEALSCGAHVLLSDIPAHRQLVGEIDENVFFADDDAGDLAVKLQELLVRLEKNERMDNPYDMQDFEWKNSMEKYAALFENCLRKVPRDAQPQTLPHIEGGNAE